MARRRQKRSLGPAAFDWYIAEILNLQNTIPPSSSCEIPAAERLRMNEDDRPTGGLGGREMRRRRSRRFRRTPFGIRRDGLSRVGEQAPESDRDGQTYAALDLGTNNCRLLIARPTADGFRVVDAFSRIIRLGEGVVVSRRISEAAIARAIEALLICRDKMRNWGVRRARLIATEACRAADNGEAFRARVAKHAGLDLEIVDSATEARLAAAGCTELFDPAAAGVILFDIGGGSSEVVRLARSDGGVGRGPPQPDIVGWASLPVGVVTLAERYGGTVVPREIYHSMVEEVAGFVQDFAAAHRGDLDSFHMLGTSGTVTTIAGVFLKLRRYDRRRVDGCWLADDEVSRVIDELMAMSFAERAANPCIGVERADLVLAGCAILDAIRRAFPCPRLRVADRGLREGMLVEMMRADGVWGEA
jgi:exopolyphosphatase / guanosine-5'-triphosphate,3'-diphosphate pyrophosphatase